MEEMNTRFKEMRKRLKLSQKQLGDSLGLSDSGISSIEKGTRSVTSKHIKLLEAAFGIREEWLRTGEEPMLIQPTTFNLDEYVKKRGASELELEIMRAFFSMEPELRQSVISHFKAHLGQSHTKTTGQDEISATITVRPAADDTKLTVEEKRHIVMTELPSEEKGQTSSVSTGGNGTGEKLA